MIEAFSTPFQYSFMAYAFWIMLIISVPTALLSCYLVLKGWSLMGDAISHAVLPGIVLAHLLSIPLILGAFCSGMVCVLTTGFLSNNSRVKQDTIMGIVFSGMFGLGIVLYTKTPTDIDFDHILFGNMLGVNNNNLLTAGIISLGVSTLLLTKQKDLLLQSFDPIHAQVVGLPVNILHYGLLAMISLTVVATLSAVGLILSIGLLILPGAIAFLLTKSLGTMFLIALGATLLSGLSGIYLSFFIDSAPAPTIILALTISFITAFFMRRSKPKKALKKL